MKIFLNCLDLIFALILLGPIFTKNKIIEPMYNSATSIFNHGLARAEHSSIKKGIHYVSGVAGKIFISCCVLIILFLYVLPKPKPEFMLFITGLFIASFYIWFAVNWIFNHKVLVLGYRIKDNSTLFLIILSIGLMFFIPEISIFRVFAEMLNQILGIVGYEFISQSNAMLNLMGLTFFLACIISMYLSFWLISIAILAFIAIFVLVSILSFKFFSKYMINREDSEQKFLTFVLVAYLITQILLRFAYG